VIIECRVSPGARGSVRVAVIERTGAPGGAGDLRVATFTGTVERWRRWRAILTAGAQAQGERLVITGREDRAA